MWKVQLIHNKNICHQVIVIKETIKINIYFLKYYQHKNESNNFAHINGCVMNMVLLIRYIRFVHFFSYNRIRGYLMLQLLDYFVFIK